MLVKSMPYFTFHVLQGSAVTHLRKPLHTEVLRNYGVKIFENRSTLAVSQRYDQNAV